MLTQELSFLLPVSLGHFWESETGDSHMLKDKPPCQGASPATASGAAATLENLLCYFVPTPNLHSVGGVRGRVCVRWDAGSEGRMTLSPNLCLESVLNLTPLISLPDLNLCWSSRQVAWGWIEDRERLTYFSHPPPVSHLLYLSSHWRTNMNWPLQWVECKRNPNSLPLSVCVPFAMRHPAPPIKDWNLPQPLEFGLACDWLWSAEWGWGDGVSVPRLHLERPEHFHSLSWFLNTP